jgi:hypothetical protein
MYIKYVEEENFAPAKDPNQAVNTIPADPQALETIEADAQDQAALTAGMEILKNYKGETENSSEDAKKGIELLNKAMANSGMMKEKQTSWRRR